MECGEKNERRRIIYCWCYAYDILGIFREVRLFYGRDMYVLYVTSDLNGVEMTRKLLPIEPTDEMIQAGYLVADVRYDSVKEIWDAMVAAYGKKPNSPQMKFTDFLGQCAESGEPAISQYKPVLEYAASINLPESMLNLAWQEFKRHYFGSTKKYSDWRKVFLNAVRGNWFGIWWINDAGEYALTTRGKQAAMNLRVGL